MARPTELSDEDFGVLDSLGEGGEHVDQPTRMVPLAQLALEASVKRAKEAGVTMASTLIEQLPDNPRAVITFQGTRVPVRISKSAFIIGRSKEVADLVVDDNDVSRQHAAILFSQGEFYLEDLRSTNGTFVAGARVDRVRLEPHTPFRLGKTVMTMCWEEEISVADFD